MSAICLKTSLRERATVDAWLLEHTAVRLSEKSGKLVSPCGSVSASRIETSRRGWIDGADRWCRSHVDFGVIGTEKLVSRGMKSSLAKNGG